ncbi:ATP-binding cassette domain-containing protein [Kribbella sp. NPDC051587]|uniref:ATP-binding cassette domain-containing protein n=1 Tax=Kribbella sp. NPDC051587 TaxID=3364119 RepID=UPI0037932ED1
MCGIRKSFAGTRRSASGTNALAGVDMSVAQGEVMALLGSNGAGKTTLVRVLTTLLRPDAGTASVAGHDVVTNPGAARSSLGAAGQYSTVDGVLTGAENLYLVGKLRGQGRKQARASAEDLLERFDLAQHAHRPAGTYSGGLRRRLDLAAALIGEPPVVLLDEPTTGLDPRSRLGLWAAVAALAAAGTTILLTTQYLEEAERLADRITVLDHGRVVAAGTVDELKARQLSRIVFVTAHERDVRAVAGLVARTTGTEPETDLPLRRIEATVTNGQEVLTTVMAGLNDIDVIEAGLLRASLDDVFLELVPR